MWPVRGLSGGNSQARKDLLRLGSRRVRACAQLVRDVACGERNLEEVLELLEGRGPCQQCVEAILRLTELSGFEKGLSAALELSLWARQFMEKLSPPDRDVSLIVRVETLSAYCLRHVDIDRALSMWQEVVPIAAKLSFRERADAYRKGSFILAEASDWDGARQLLRSARQFHRLADEQKHEVMDAERYLGAVDAAEMYVEVSAVFLGEPADLQSAVDAGRRLLKTTKPEDAPRTWLCGTSNFLAVAVYGWRLGIGAISASDVVRIVDDLLADQARPQNVLSIYLRWLWCLAVGEEEGLSRRVRRRFAGVRSALVADSRHLEAVRALLDMAWIDAYRGRYRPLKERWIQDAEDLCRLGNLAGADEKLLHDWSQACNDGWIPSDLATSIFHDVRGLPPNLEHRSISLY